MTVGLNRKYFTLHSLSLDPCSELIPLIDGPKPLPDSQIKASSSESSRSGPDAIKMKSKGKQLFIRNY